MMEAAANTVAGVDNESSKDKVPATPTITKQDLENPARIEMMEKEVVKKLRKERTADCGIKLIKDKTVFSW